MTTWGEHYHAIASRMALFTETNRRLAEIADLRPGHAVLDLGCGSGLTSLAALDQVPGGLRLYLADSSASMVEQARKVVGDRAAGYYTVDAAAVASALPEKVDRVLCNMAFFSFREPEAVLEQVRQVLKPLGRLCFTLSGTYMNTGVDALSPQWAYLRVLKRKGEPVPAVQDPERMPNQRSIEGTLMACRFKPFHYEVQELHPALPETEPGGELHSLLQLYPAMPGATHREAVERSLAALPLAAPEMAQYRPRWRIAFFMAQPAISPEEALMMKAGQFRLKP